MSRASHAQRRRHALAIAAASAALAGVLAGFALVARGGEASAQDPGGAGAAGRPNVVVIMTDDQDERSLEVMDAADRHLADQGTTFENFFSTFPLCCPARATLLTGQYSHNHGVRSNKPPNGGYAAFKNARGTLPVSLNAAGYRTGYVGKYLNGYSRDDEPEIPRGWDEWYAPFGSRGVQMYDYSMNENGRIHHYGDDPRDYQTDVFARKATRFIGRASRGASPFFVTLATGAPHSEGREPPNPRPAARHRGAFDDAPLPKPPSFNEEDVSDKPSFIQELPLLGRRRLRALKQKNQDRRASLLAIDDAVDGVVEKLRDTGELDNTLIFFMSDNGFMLGEHRRDGKTVLYEESVGVPFIMRGPGIPAGASREQLAGNVDIAPTIIDVTGAEPRRVMDGTSLIPLAQNPSSASGRDILLENRSSAAIRTHEYMYAEHPRGERELYDLGRDPFQLESRHQDASYQDVASRLAQRLAEVRNCAGDSCP